MQQIQLITILSDGQFHSGEDLGAAVGVSRAAVWKQIQKLAELGVEVESVRGQGYRVLGGIDLIAPADIAVTRFDIELLSVTTSTNSLLMDQAQQGSIHLKAISADMQTHGRGRRGRAWISPYASNMYLSVGWEFQSGAAALSGLSLAVGVAVVEALSKLGVSGVGLKWPNDILHNGLKLGGILIEMGGDPSGDCHVVIGLGLNVHMAGASSQAIDQPWTTCDKLTEKPLARAKILSCLLDALESMLETYEQHGFSAYHQQWEQLHDYQNQVVIITSGENKSSGVAQGVDGSGALIVETSLGRKLFHGGEVSVRRSK
ncbi:Bifunctional ligase/repressor BirA [Sinobacterium norvegicum]|uniref:Bifunctional ligase/repressor BirA n=1 Tax=Sinobacterium norvegicum TaxID=1641715 RepID=A0ABM9AJH0_9GAMM|nr:bifunctional biotin--[acetyl-CoA-carboxylase] ligase/biotin operon repressor BirA [Sinobacterium norvegicum]CAH0993219.1 Bifunctional ligase/repressor BirA [Sinobacterium norvegicum]